MADYDAFVLVSFGGPERPADVMPFLENVTRGRAVPRERLAEVAHHYEQFGGVSPINQQCRDLLAAIEKDFAASGLDLPLYWGNRNWHPYLADTVAAMAADGVRRAIAFVTSAYGSYSSCRQYLDDIEAARLQAGPGAPAIDKIRHFFNHPGFIGPFTEATLAAIESLPPAAQARAPLVFTAHSVPESMAASSGPAGGLYPAQLAEAARLVTAGAAAADGHERSWRLVYQSRSGPPSVPWLGPDVCDHLAGLAAAGAPGAVLVPVGFVSDHLEVRYDLDVEAAQLGQRLGLPLARAATPGTHPRFVSMITDLVRERTGEAVPGRRERPVPGREERPAPGQGERPVPGCAIGVMGPGPDTCPDGCCRPQPPARGAGRPGGSA
ncbi:MAG TPA: ferrochelatase [Streptosporangiaceae bacterium]|nr:ferrochelatase [Streptosporangiaceae bacterium]